MQMCYSLGVVKISSGMEFPLNSELLIILMFLLG